MYCASTFFVFWEKLQNTSFQTKKCFSMASKTTEGEASETADIPFVAEQLLSLQEHRRDDEREDAFDDPG